MLELIDVGDRSLDAYRGIAPDDLLSNLRELGRSLRGARILHVNATPYGGGVSELLRSTVPIMNDLGLIADWKIIHGDDAYYDVTKKIHNMLQGADVVLTDSEKAIYRENAERNAAMLQEVYDVVFIHDPQPAGILATRGKGDSSWVWRCHIDTSCPNPAAWEFVRSQISEYDAAIFTLADFVPPDFDGMPTRIFPPAIDPLSPKNIDLDDDIIRSVLQWIGIRTDRPIVCQVSRFDPWKDPLGVIDAFRYARREIPGLQLALVGSMALDDPEGWQIYRQIREEADTDSDIHVFTNLTGVGNIEVNAFQRISDVVVQKSTREGFGLVVSEAMWKATPVVAGRAGGIPLQMADGIGGILVDNVAECAAAMVALLRDKERARDLGEAGRERVRQQFLLPRLVFDELSLVRDLFADRVTTSRIWRDDQDPVCGMTVDVTTDPPASEFDGRSYVFCSKECKIRFDAFPSRFL